MTDFDKTEGKGKTEKASYDTFCLFPTEEKGKLAAAYSLNCSFADGKLQCGIGYERYHDRNGEEVATGAAEGIRAVYVMEAWSDGGGTELQPYYFIRTDKGEAMQYVSLSDGYITKANLGKNANMAAVSAPDGTTRIVICGDGGAYCVDGEDWTKIEDVDEAQGTAAICFSKNRVFLGEKPCKLLYSNPELPWDFTHSYDEGGYVYLPLNKGNIVDMLEYGEWVYVFFQRGIMRVKPDGLARNFQVEEVSYFGGEIFGGSVGICENWIFFLSENGICRFDGRNVERVGKQYGVTPSKEGGVCTHATVGDYYVLKYPENSFGTERTIALRADGKDGYFLSDYVGLNECNRMPICSVDNALATLRLGGKLPTGEEFVFESGFLELGGVGRKHLKSVTLYGEGCMTFSVLCDEDEEHFEVEDLPYKLKLRVGMRGEDFSLRFVLEQGAKVRRVVLEYERLD
ncbi:MAG: hypothetical protein IJ308_08310 [Clostridia bacterium]|nr:hypothetical protein [Clostridia bacterium]MBQ7913721.1 hypothetical protein [Clostridia bacterium]